jgi:hypothetical protein
MGKPLDGAGGAKKKTKHRSHKKGVSAATGVFIVIMYFFGLADAL